MGDEAARIVNDVRRVGLLILAAAQSVKKPLDRARIAPLHRRVCHACDGLIKVEGGAEPPEDGEHDGDQPFEPQFPGLPGEPAECSQGGQREQQSGTAENRDSREQNQTGRQRGVHAQFLECLLRENRKPHVGGDRAESDDEVNSQHHIRGVEHSDIPQLVQDEAQDEENAVPEKCVAAKPGLDQGYGDFDAHGRDEERLMDGGADAKEEHRAEQVTPLSWGVDPPEQADQHDHHPRDAEEGNAVDGDRLAPHDAAEAQQQARDDPRHHTNGALPLAREAFQIIDPFDEHAAAAGNEECHKAAGHGGGGGLAHLHTPCDVADGKQLRPEPGVNRPKWITRRVGNAGVEGSRAQFPGVFEGQLRREGQQIDDPDRGERDQERHPIDFAEKRRHSLGRLGRRGRFGGRADGLILFLVLGWFVHA